MNAPTTAWTIGQLATRVAEALAAGVPGQANGRVREVPDVRTLRWYTSIGLLDRPAAMRGRTALYGRRHLLQVVAIKRLQGEGWSIAEIQERLIGAGDAVLEGIAAVPEGELGPGGSQDAGVSSEDVAPVARRTRFWAAAPAAPAESDGSDGSDERDEAGAAATVTLSRSAAPAVEVALSRQQELRSPTLAQAIRIASDVTLLLDTDRAPDTADLTAIAEAARPLLDLLRHLGLSEP